jgi:hypothetical protein
VFYGTDLCTVNFFITSSVLCTAGILSYKNVILCFEEFHLYCRFAVYFLYWRGCSVTCRTESPFSILLKFCTKIYSIVCTTAEFPLCLSIYVCYVCMYVCMYVCRVLYCSNLVYRTCSMYRYTFLFYLVIPLHSCNFALQLFHFKANITLY